MAHQVPPSTFTCPLPSVLRSVLELTMEVGLLGFWFIQSLVVEISSSSNAEKSGAVMVLLLTAGVFSDLIALGI